MAHEVIIIDGDCALCRTLGACAVRRNEAFRLAAGDNPNEVEVRLTNGTSLFGSEAWIYICRRLGFPMPTGPVFAWLADRIYSMVARNRRILSFFVRRN
ncbi:MAG TPA: hypothetical protein VFG65_08335 [Fimbriimonadales bacterium]|jgi:predicted DCC family thiol-disulfide oxidoreductase YuxK|nr:hypothetical protein [Fimbriimonadales bacterium]